MLTNDLGWNNSAVILNKRFSFILIVLSGNGACYSYFVIFSMYSLLVYVTRSNCFC